MTDSENGHPARPADPTDDPTARIDVAGTEEAPRAWSASGRTETTPFDDLPETTQVAGGYPAQGYPAGGYPADGFAPIPPTGTPPSGQPVRGAPARRNTGKIIAGVAAVLVLVVVIAAVGTELYVRSKTKDCLQDAFTSLTGTATTVSISSEPVLLQRLSGTIPYVQVDTADKSDAITLHARADDITDLGSTPKAGSITGTGSAPFSRVIAMSKQLQNGASTGTGSGNNGGGNNGGTSDGPLAGLMQGATIDSMTGNSTDGTVTVNSTVQVAILPIPVTTTIKPVVTDGHIKFDVVSAQAFVFGVPTDYAQNIVDSVTKGMFGSLTDEVNVTELKVTDQGVDFAFNGKGVTLGDQAASGTQLRCS